ncbi:MAG: ATP-binding protein [Mycoplasmataceae bacterium]|nr:ATP-binding protein [Mycoplasmataceae bacterium]
MLIRDKTKAMRTWYDSKSDLVLHIRGMRQVGKTTMVINFLKSIGEDYVMLDMTLQEDIELFEKGIITRSNYLDVLSTHFSKTVTADTLIFIDEIQLSTQAYSFIKIYRDTCNMNNNLVRLIVSGSYVEVTVSFNSEFPVPVGCIQTLTLRPLSFKEFLFNLPNGELYIKHIYGTIIRNEPISTRLHNELLSHIKSYLLIGGMPMVVQNFMNLNMKTIKLTDKSIIEHIVSPLHEIIVKQKHDIQRNHFKNKDMTKAYKKKIIAIYEKIATLYKEGVSTGNKNQGNNISRFILKGLPNPKMREYEEVIEHLQQGSIISLNQKQDTNSFKLIFSDVGILAINWGFDDYFKVILSMTSNKGSIYEQFVGNELLSYGPEFNKLKYWSNPRYEIDYILPDGTPIEVKSGKNTRAKSLEKFNKGGYRITNKKFSTEGKFTNIPVYAIWLLNEYMDK